MTPYIAVSICFAAALFAVISLITPRIAFFLGPDKKNRKNAFFSYLGIAFVAFGVVAVTVPAQPQKEVAEKTTAADPVVETEGARSPQKSRLVDKTQLDSLSPEVKSLIETAWPKVEASCPGIDKHSSILEFQRIEDNFSYASSKEAERVSVVFKVKESPSLVIGDYVTNGHNCFFQISRDGSRLTVPKRPCASLCEGRAVHTSEYTKALLSPGGGAPNDPDAGATKVSPSKTIMPTYDSGAYCKQVSDVSGGSYSIEAGCMDMEKSARKAIAAMNIEPRIASYCDDVAQTSGGSYSMFKGCIDMEMQSKKNLGK